MAAPGASLKPGARLSALEELVAKMETDLEEGLDILYSALDNQKEATDRLDAQEVASVNHIRAQEQHDQAVGVRMGLAEAAQKKTAGAQSKLRRRLDAMEATILKQADAMPLGRCAATHVQFTHAWCL